VRTLIEGTNTHTHTHTHTHTCTHAHMHGHAWYNFSVDNKPQVSKKIISASNIIDILVCIRLLMMALY
jgi:hypothetical protein